MDFKQRQDKINGLPLTFCIDFAREHSVPDFIISEEEDISAEDCVHYMLQAFLFEPGSGPLPDLVSQYQRFYDKLKQFLSK